MLFYYLRGGASVADEVGLDGVGGIEDTLDDGLGFENPAAVLHGLEEAAGGTVGEDVLGDTGHEVADGVLEVLGVEPRDAGVEAAPVEAELGALGGGVVRGDGPGFGASSPEGFRGVVTTEVGEVPSETAAGLAVVEYESAGGHRKTSMTEKASLLARLLSDLFLTNIRMTDWIS
ncbi:MAG: hypothetical protein WA399_05985 [Acidobacteriaceae bacterium]